MTSEALGYYLLITGASPYIVELNLNMNHKTVADTRIIAVSRPRGSQAGGNPGHFG